MKTIFLLIVLTTLYFQSYTQSLYTDPYMSLYNGEVIISNLYKGDNKIGQLIFLQRGHVKANYIACSDEKFVYQKFNEWGKNKRIIAYCSGAFSTGGDYDKPLGLTIESGRVCNRQIDEKLDGLCIVEEAGGIRIADLDKINSLFLSSLNLYVNPRMDSRDKNILINWAIQQRATVLQMPLLFFKNTPKFGDVPKIAERRLLAIMTLEGIVYHILINVEEAVSLTSISKEIFEYLTNYGLEMIALLNLDTGNRNCFQVFNEKGLPLSFKGPTPISKASNLLIYYYSNENE